MSGDDWEDDWENEDAVEAKVEAAKKEKERARRRAEGLDSESEADEEPKAVTPKAAAPSPKAAEAKKASPKAKQKDKNKKKTEPAVDERLLDPEAEKLRLRKLEEEQNERATADLFGVGSSPVAVQEKARKEEDENTKAAAGAAKVKIITVDAFDDVTLKVQADVEQLCQTCIQKIQKGSCKGAQFKFLLDLVKQVEETLTTKELGELEKQLADIVKEKKKPSGATVVKANKANTKVSKTTKFNTNNEWEDVYGGGDDDEWTQEEWDEWEKQQAAAWKDKA